MKEEIILESNNNEHSQIRTADSDNIMYSMMLSLSFLKTFQ